MTPQETFDRVVTHLRKQGRKSVDPSTHRCMYRGPDGLKCAVGALIPDEKYSAVFETKGTLWSPIRSVLLELGHDPTLCNSLQLVHDSVSVDNWESHFEIVADKYHLKYTPITAPVAAHARAEEHP